MQTPPGEGNTVAQSAPVANTQVTAPNAGDNTAKALENLQKNITSAGRWFFWIAGLSLINSIIMMAGGNTRFIVGLGVTSLIDGFAKGLGRTSGLILLPVYLVILAIYCVFGYFACQRKRWAFITGIVLYALDAVILLLFKEYMSVAFHAFALFCIFAGLKADTQLRQLEARMAWNKSAQ
jgi:hypothetical protein